MVLQNNSQYLPDVGLSFSSCLVVLFSHLLVVVNILETKRERKVRINSVVLYSSEKNSTTLLNIKQAAQAYAEFNYGFNIIKFVHYIIYKQRKQD